MVTNFNAPTQSSHACNQAPAAHHVRCSHSTQQHHEQPAKATWQVGKLPLASVQNDVSHAPPNTAQGVKFQHVTDHYTTTTATRHLHFKAHPMRSHHEVAVWCTHLTQLLAHWGDLQAADTAAWQ